MRLGSGLLGEKQLHKTTDTALVHILGYCTKPVISPKIYDKMSYATFTCCLLYTVALEQFEDE